MRRSLRAVLATCAALGVGLTACSSDAPKLIPILSDKPPSAASELGGVSLPSRADDLAVVLDVFLCGTRDVPITSLQLYKPSSGIRLVRWGIANKPYDQMKWENTVAGLRSGGPFRSRTVTARCHETQWYSRVALELHRTQPRTQSFTGVRFSYRSAGKEKVGYVAEWFRIREPARRRG